MQCRQRRLQLGLNHEGFLWLEGLPRSAVLDASALSMRASYEPGSVR